ncbi:MAG TPA: DUF1259 domain-containing protein [Candidatus Rubrimentiphilum sp.]|nr:DUF1259 domain-containing protein [Candidatus Rubrimentiphilum sp.]
MPAALAAASPTLDTAAISGALGRSGQTMDGGVYRVSFPRSDLHVKIGSTTLLPGFALGGYAAFIGRDQGVLAVGDLVLVESEIQPVMQALEQSGFQITALHNHLRGESPHVMYMHFMVSGDAGTIAKALRAALALSKTPLGPVAASVPKVLAFQDAIESGLGRKGKISGSVLSFSIPRMETISMNGTTVPPAAGVATAINFEDAGGGNVATTGDFVLLGSEVPAVENALLANGIQITALHHHMLEDAPHLYYMHFWAVGPPSRLATALAQALSHANVKT